MAQNSVIEGSVYWDCPAGARPKSLLLYLEHGLCGSQVSYSIDACRWMTRDGMSHIWEFCRQTPLSVLSSWFAHLNKSATFALLHLCHLLRRVMYKANAAVAAAQDCWCCLWPKTTTVAKSMRIEWSQPSRIADRYSLTASFTKDLRSRRRKLVA